MSVSEQGISDRNLTAKSMVPMKAQVSLLNQRPTSLGTDFPPRTDTC